MKIKGLALAVLALLLPLISAGSAFADPNPTPSTTSTATPNFQTMMNQYKNMQDLRDQQRKQINRIFMVAVEAANRDAEIAMKFAKGASAKNEVIARQKAAITLASNVRDAAIAALGALPTPPIKVAKNAEIAPKNKMKAKKTEDSSTKKPNK